MRRGKFVNVYICSDPLIRAMSWESLTIRLKKEMFILWLIYSVIGSLTTTLGILIVKFSTVYYIRKSIPLIRVIFTCF